MGKHRRNNQRSRASPQASKPKWYFFLFHQQTKTKARHQARIEHNAEEWKDSPLLPLNRPRRLAGDVIGHAIDPAHLIHNPRRNAIEEAHVKRIDIRRHAIRAGDGA